MKKSKYGKLNFRDIVKGVLIAISTAFVAGLGQSLTMGAIPSNFNDLQPIAIASLSAGAAYVGKQLTTNSEGELWKKETEPIEKVE